MRYLLGGSQVEINAAALRFHGNLESVARKHRIGIEHVLRRRSLVLAVWTNTKYLHLVSDCLKLILRDNHLLQLFQLGAEKLNGSIAIDADNVMVMRPMIDVFETGSPVLKIGFSRQTTIGKSFEGSEHCGKADSWILLLHQLVELVDAEMPSGTQETLNNHLALASHFQAVSL